MPRGTSLLDEARLQRRLWTPAALSPVLWLRADDPLNYKLWTSTGRAEVWGVLGNAGTIGGPLLVTNAWQSRAPAFVTDASDKNVSGSLGVSFNEVTFAVVTRENTRLTTDVFVAESPNGDVFFQAPNGSNEIVFICGPVGVGGPINAVGTHNVIGFQNSVSRNRICVFRDGAIVASNAESSSVTTANSSSFGRGEQAYAEAVMVLGASDANVDRLFGYLSHKWNIADRLPGSHPYRNSPPMLGG